MEFCISRDVLGSDRHLMVDATGQRWLDAAPAPETLVLSTSVDHERPESSLNALMAMNGVSGSFAPPERFVSAMRAVVTGSLPVPWQKALPRPEFDRFVSTVVGAARQFLPTAPVGYFSSTFRELSGLFQALQPASVDLSRLRTLAKAEQNPSQLEVLKSFMPVNDGMTQPVVYDRTHRTGRLTVVEGPQILTLKRAHRSVLRSRWGPDGGVYYLDYTSLEPRVVLQYAGVEAPRDVYDHVSNGLLGGQYTRDVVKQVTISLLYGAGNKSLAEATGLPTKEVRAVASVVRKFLDIDRSAKRLVAECTANGGVVRNQFGRHVRVSTFADHIVLNAYAQSTAVDLALLGFKFVVDRVMEQGLRCVPLFVLHDALLVDCHDDSVGGLDSIRTSAQSDAPGVRGLYPIKLERLTSKEDR